MSNDLKFCEYIWLDGSKPVAQIRSKTKIVSLDNNNISISNFPYWSFDGSSTSQAEGENSDLELQPVFFTKNPITDGYLVLCEVFDFDGKPHETNSRAKLRNILESGGKNIDPWFGFEQEYTMFKRNIPLGWPEHGFPAPQGPYYCGVGSEQIFGREIAERHAELCLKAGLLYYGLNAEVIPGQWEFQIGYRSVDSENAGAINISDHMWVARWLLHRISEDYNIHISFDNKPIKGNWNGAGMHTNFSTSDMRNKSLGPNAIKDAIEKLSKKHNEHIEIYGDKLEERLTGEHETANINQFSYGNSNRTSSVRIPPTVSKKGYGYLEDRRPGANADPYLVAAKIIETLIS